MWTRQSRNDRVLVIVYKMNTMEQLELQVYFQNRRMVRDTRVRQASSCTPRTYAAVQSCSILFPPTLKILCSFPKLSASIYGEGLWLIGGASAEHRKPQVHSLAGNIR
uniref:Uncharacterized protein n=1 Tax=Sphaerodactylus townsendi TaxID=933632 RepID=A0ACB8ERS5_9SAUR